MYVPIATSLFSSPAAPPLTLENVLDVVKNVKSWRTLGQVLNPFSEQSKLDAIRRQHVSDEARLKAVVEDFLSGWHGQQSWRRLTWYLYQANESQLAERIRSFAEPVQGTVANDECVATDPG